MAEIVDRHLGDHRHVAARGFVPGHHRLAQFIEVAESLEDQQIDPGFEQGIDLFAESGARFGEGSRSQRFDAHVERAHGAGDERAVGRLAGQPHAGQIDGLQLFGEAERAQTLPGGAERVGFQDLGARLGVLLMDLANHVRRGEVELIEAAIDEHAARVEHGTHRAIGHNHTAGQLVTKFLGAGTDGCSHERRSQMPSAAQMR